MNINKKQILMFLAVAVTFFVASSVTLAQTDSTPKKRLKNPATVKGFIGGESHDSYGIKAQKGQIMTVQISWLRNDENRASFTVTKSTNFYNANSVKFGRESLKGKRWSCKIPQTGNYYIYVVAYPTAKYTLKVLVK